MFKLLTSVLLLLALTGCDDKNDVFSDIATISDVNTSAGIVDTDANISKAGTIDQNAFEATDIRVEPTADSTSCSADTPAATMIENTQKTSTVNLLLTSQNSQSDTNSFGSSISIEADNDSNNSLVDQDNEDNTDTIEINAPLETNDNDNMVYDDGNNSLTGQNVESDTDSNETNTPPETGNVNDNNNSLTDKNVDITAESNLSLEPYYHQQWYLEKNETFYSDNSIDPNASVDAGEMLEHYTGRGVTIAVIDDGVDMMHEELDGSIVATYDIKTHSPNVSHNEPGSYHGTAVTGIIAANLNGRGIVGIARESDIIFLKYKEGMSDSETIELFNKAEMLGADIINCSWGTYNVSPAVKETIQKLAHRGRDGKGIVIVFAAGNNDRHMGNDESSIPEVIAVGSTDRDNLRSWYSNYGEHLDILAPGGYEVGITTLDPMGSRGIGMMDDNYLLSTDPYSFIGTSASAPIVTGAIALLLEKNPELTRREIENLLKNRSDKIGNVEYNAGHNIYYGYGKVNVGRLLGE